MPPSSRAALWALGEGVRCALEAATSSAPEIARPIFVTLLVQDTGPHKSARVVAVLMVAVRYGLNPAQVMRLLAALHLYESHRAGAARRGSPYPSWLEMRASWGAGPAPTWLRPAWEAYEQAWVEEPLEAPVEAPKGPETGLPDTRRPDLLTCERCGSWILLGALGGPEDLRRWAEEHQCSM